MRLLDIQVCFLDRIFSIILALLHVLQRFDYIFQLYVFIYIPLLAVLKVHVYFGHKGSFRTILLKLLEIILQLFKAFAESPRSLIVYRQLLHSYMVYCERSTGCPIDSRKSVMPLFTWATSILASVTTLYSVLRFSFNLAMILFYCFRHNATCRGFGTFGDLELVQSARLSIVIWA